MARRSSSAARTRSKRRLTWRQLHDLVSRMQQAFAGLGVGPGDRVAGAACPICPRRSRRCSPPPRSARCGPRPRRTSGRAACSTASARSSPRSSSPPTATTTPARRSTSPTSSPRSPPGCRAAPPIVVVPYLGRAERDRGAAPQRADARRCARALRGEAGRVRAPALRPPALHPVLVGHDGRAEVHRPLGRRDAACSTSRSTGCSRASSRANRCSTSPPAAG